MSDKPLKLYRATATIEYDFEVLAEDSNRAHVVADASAYEAWKDFSPMHEIRVREVTYRRELSYATDADLKSTSPYGPIDRTYEDGFDSPQRTVWEYMEELGIK